MALDDYVLLGRSGLRVSRLALGGMTFGTPWTGHWGASKASWGIDEPAANEVLAAYIDAGGNFIDTSDHYGRGASEEIIGRFTAAGGLRDRLVICTKAGFIGEDGNPNAGGSGRKNLMRSLEGSLRRLGTDYVDLFLLHIWDGLTPAEEVLRTFDDVVRSGKARHVGLSNMPAYFASRFQALADAGRGEPACTMQLEYSLTERNIECEHVPLCLDTAMGVMVYSPLASGFLSGKYRREGGGEGRLSRESRMARFNARNWAIHDALEAVAGEIGRPMAQVALRWVLDRPAVASVIIGVTSVAQLRSNIAALDFTISEEMRARLDETSAPDLHYPYAMLRDTAAMYLGAKVTRL